MSDANDESAFLHELEVNVRAELTLVEIDQATGESVVETEEVLFEQVEAERYEIGLRGLLGAVEALEDDSRPGADPSSTGRDEASGR